MSVALAALTGSEIEFQVGITFGPLGNSEGRPPQIGMEHHACSVDYPAQRRFQQGIDGAVYIIFDRFRGLFAPEQGSAGIVENAAYLIDDARPECLQNLADGRKIPKGHAPMLHW